MQNNADADSTWQMVMVSLLYMIIMGVSDERTTVMRTTCITCLLLQLDLLTNIAIMKSA